MQIKLGKYSLANQMTNNVSTAAEGAESVQVDFLVFSHM